MSTYYNFNEAYRDTLKKIKHFGVESSPRGRKTKELLAHKFIIENPTQRLIGYKTRELNIFYAIGNFLWVMAQSNELKFIEYYNPRGRNFSDDTQHLRGAYGKRIFDFDGVNQFHLAINELKLDKDSRRALISIHMPQHDWTGSLDTPCTADFQLLIRNNMLYMVNHMRSQSGAMVMAYDIFLMTMIQEYAATLLGIEVGPYIHICNSIHFFEDEEKLVDKILEESNPNNMQQGRMPKETDYQMLKKLLYFEKDLREEAIFANKQKYNKLDFEYWTNYLYRIDLPQYWDKIAILLLVKAYLYIGNKERAKLLIEATLKNTPYYHYLQSI